MLCCVFIIDCAEVEDEKSRWWRLAHVATNVPSDTTVVNDVIMVWGVDCLLVGLELMRATVSEGESLECCVVIISGTAETEHVLITGSVPFTATVLDYESFSETITFVVGDTVGDRECINVQISADDETEIDEDFFVYTLIISNSPQEIEIEISQFLKRITIIDAPNIQNVIVGFQRTEITVSENCVLEVVCAVILSNQALTQDVEVTISSTDDTAVSCVPGQVDYLSLSAILTFPSGSMNGAQQCVCVTILDDDLPEAPEQFILSLTSNSPSVTIINDTATVFINDTSPNTLFGFTQTEAQVQERLFVDICVIQLSPGPLFQPVTLELILLDKDATMPDDYSPQAESVTFGINSMESDTECVRVIIVDDDIVEEAETFTVVLETASYMEVETDESLSSLVVTIIDDDGACIGLTSMNLTVDEGDEEIFACVELLKPPILMNESSFQIFTRDGTALADDDYIRQSRSCRFPSGSMAGDTQCLSIPIIDNSIPDGDREFTTVLITFDPLVQIEPAQGDLNILITDNDIPQLRLQELEYSVQEDNGRVEVCVELVGGSLFPSAIAFVSTQSQTALAGMDFVPLNDGVVTFSPGSSSGDSTCIALDIIDDEIVETTQSFAVRIVGFSDNVNVPPDGDTATVMILDDDVSPNVTILFKERSMVARENSQDPAMVCIQLCPGNQSRTVRDVRSAMQDIRFEFTTKPGSADDVEDYVRSDTSFAISSDLSQKSQMCAAVTVNNDNQVEGDKAFSACLSDVPPANCIIVEGGGSINVTIEDDEVPAVGFQLVEAAINESYPDKFACVEIKFSLGPLEADIEIEFYTQDGSAQAPEDYATLVTTLTFQQGTDGSLRRARDAACVSVFIFDDDLPEDTESFSFHIRSPDTSSVRIMEGYEQTTIHIIDNDVLNVSMDKPSYTVMENVGQGDLGLRVCATVIEAAFEFTVLLIPHDDSAIEIIDYRVGPGRMDFFEIPGEQSRCVCIEIVDNSNCTGNKSFSLTLYPLSDAVTAATEPVLVTIIDDDIDVVDGDTELRFIENSPRVSGVSVAANLMIGSKFSSVTCSVTGRDPVDCLSAFVAFSDLPNRVEPFTFLVTGILSSGCTVSLERRFRVDSDQCSAHLINDGVTVSGDCVTVEWQGTGPAAESQIVNFICSIDEGPLEPCMSFDRFTRCGLSEGSHQLVVQPELSDGCIPLIVPFVLG